MREFSLQEAARSVGGRAIETGIRFKQVATDTRSMTAGALFVALDGEHFDGHDFIDQAIRQQACAAVVSRPVVAQIPLIRVPDTRRALGALGRMNRRAFTGPVVGITGSAGKTGTREMIGRVLGAQGTVLATRGNLNNEVGVPLTLFEIAPEHGFAVVEMGAARRGDIAYLAEWVCADVAVVTNAMPAHIAGMGSLEGVARTKGALYESLPTDGIAVLCLDDPHAGLWQQQITGRRTVTCSMVKPEADVRAEQIRLGASGASHFLLCLPDRQIPVCLQVLGRHQVGNALAAAAVGYALGRTPEQIVSGLQCVEPMPGRLMPVLGHHASRLIDDSYNANPGSMAAAIELLAAWPGRRILVVGDMGELGDEGVAQHRRLGLQARGAGIDRLLALGPLSKTAADEFGPGAQHFTSRAALIEVARELQDRDSVLLIKGSRAAGMDRVLAELRADDKGAG